MSGKRINLAIIGVGLIGGSLGLCLKDKMGEDIYITGLCRTQQSMDNAMNSCIAPEAREKSHALADS